MIYQEDRITLGKIVFDDMNQKKKLWASLGQTVSRSPIVFLSHLFVISLIAFGCIWTTYIWKKCDKSIVCVGNLCSTAEDILHSPRK